MKEKVPEYLDFNSPWWQEFNEWCHYRPVDLDKITPYCDFSITDDRRIVQFCTFLRKLVLNEEKAIQENDSLTRWMLLQRNIMTMHRKVRYNPRKTNRAYLVWGLGAENAPSPPVHWK